MRHWANNVLTQNTVILNPGDTTLVVQDDSTFPNNVIGGFDFGSGDTFLLTMRSSLTSASPNEILLVTGNPSGTSYNVTRAQEGTTAQQWVVGSIVAGQLTAEAVNEYEQGTGTVNPVNTGDSIAGDGDANPLEVNFGPDVFGLGGESILLNNTHDLDNITDGGDYHWHLSSTPVNSPTVQSATMKVVGGSSSGAALNTTGSQVVIDRINRIFIRHKLHASGLPWTPFFSPIDRVVSNETLIGQGNSSSPLGVNTNVFETSINTDNSLTGDGSIQNLLAVNHEIITLDATESPHELNILNIPNGAVINIDNPAFGNQIVNFIFASLGSGSLLPIPKKFYMYSPAGPGTSTMNIEIREGDDSVLIESDVGNMPDINVGSGLITFMAVLDPFALPNQYLLVSGAVVAGT